MQLLLLAASAAALVFIADILIRAFRQRIAANKLGCGDVTKYPHSRFFGLDLRDERVKAFIEGRYNRRLSEEFERFGNTWQESIYWERTINTIETANLQAIAAVKFSDFQKHPYRTKVQHPFTGLGVFSSNGKRWRRSRDMIMPIFKRAQLSDVDSFKKFVDRFFDALPPDGDTVDLVPYLQKLFLDNSSEFIFGESIDSLRDTSGKSQDFISAFDRAVQGLGKRAGFFNGRLNFVFMFDRAWKEDCARVHGFVDKQVERAYEKVRKESEAQAEATGEAVKSVQKESQTGRYVLIHDMARQEKDPVQLRFELVNVFLPARDASVLALSNALFFLARHPKEWNKLRGQSLALKDTKMTFELIQSLHDFRYALFEGMRLQGPAPRFTRMAIRDTTIPRGGGPDGSLPVFVPKGTNVAVHLYSKFHDPEVWGEDVEDYRPSRFSGRPLGWDFTPFFGGPRICPAVQQVISQSIYLLVRLTAEYETMENRDECYHFVERASVFAESANGVKVAFHRAGESWFDPFLQ